MAIPVRGNNHGLAARVTLLAVFLGSAMMISGLSCSLALYAIKKSGRSPSRSSSLLHSLRRFAGFLAAHPLGVLGVLLFSASIYSVMGRIKLWRRSRRQAGGNDGTGELMRRSRKEDEGRDSGKKGSTCCSEEEPIREWDLEGGMRLATSKELSTRHIWDPETGASIRLPKWGIVP